ncbi:MAG: glycosyltransferase [Thermodesulfobacteriota bacterium]
MKVLHIFATLPVGGAEEHLRTVLLTMDSSVFEATVCCIGETGVIGEEIAALGFDLVGLGRMKKKRWDWQIVKAIEAIINERGIDLVHTQLYHANMYGRLAAFRARKPVIITEHNVYATYKYKRRLINRFLGKRTDRVIAVSKPVSDYIIERDGLDPSLVEVIYNGIDVERFTESGDSERAEVRKELGLAADTPVVGMIARLSKQKGHTYMLKALKEVKKTVPALKAIVAGDGPLKDEITTEANSLGLARDVIFLGARRDVPRLLKAMDIYLMPSLWEGHPIALLEAMASGLPVVAARVGGVPNVITDGVDGILIDPEDTAALISSMTELLIDSERAASIGAEAAKCIAAKFSAGAMVSKMERLYTEVTAAHDKGFVKSAEA